MNWIQVSIICLLLLAVPGRLAAETWEEVLTKMPLRTNAMELNRTNVAAVLLEAFQANQSVKSFVMMPGATDEFYFFRRASVKLTNASPTLLDAVRAITNQTHITVKFLPPHLLLRTDEDPSEPQFQVLDNGMAEKLKARPYLPSFVYNDQDWDHVQPALAKVITGRWLGLPEFQPRPKTSASWHFFRHTVAGWNLTQWETLEALSLAGQTTVTVRKTKIVFEGDTRMVKTRK
jgi:hypothetical protein